MGKPPQDFSIGLRERGPLAIRVGRPWAGAREVCLCQDLAVNVCLVRLLSLFLNVCRLRVALLQCNYKWKYSL